MGFRFRKSVRLAPGIRVNFGRKSASVSMGVKGLTLSKGTKGSRLTASLPGTGLGYSMPLQRSRAALTGRSKLSVVILCAAGAIILFSILISVLK